MPIHHSVITEYAFNVDLESGPDFGAVEMLEGEVNTLVTSVVDQRVALLHAASSLIQLDPGLAAVRVDSEYPALAEVRTELLHGDVKGKAGHVDAGVELGVVPFLLLVLLVALPLLLLLFRGQLLSQA